MGRRRKYINRRLEFGGGIELMNKILEAVKEASISVACLQDDNFESKKELDEDLIHIQKQLTIIENYFEEQNYE